MDLQLTGKTALVTGSTAGIGLAIATALAREGARVLVNGRTAARVEAAVAAVRAEVPTADIGGFAGDLTDARAVAALFATHPHVDILVNNLGVYAAAPLAAVGDADWVGMFTTNVLSGARLSQHYLPRMTAAGWGRVVFLASETGVNVPADMIPYGVSKAAQIALARGLAETTAGTGVTVNSVLPGPTHSEGVSAFLADLPLDQSRDRAAVEAEFLRKLRPTSLLQRFARADEVASLVAYLASPRSSATNGAALRVEGGLLRGIL